MSNAILLSRMGRPRIVSHWALSVSFVALLHVACSEVQGPAPSRRAITTTRMSTRPGLDGVFERIANDVPGFGGMYFDSLGDLNVWFKGPADAEALKVSVHKHLGPHILETHYPKTVTPRLLFTQASFDWHELVTYYNVVRSSVGLDLLHFTDIDEVRQRIRLGARSEAKKALLLERLAGLSLPKGLVEVDVRQLSATAQTIKSVQDSVRPRIGGVYITNSGGALCTLGFNAFLNGARVAITNMHCAIPRTSVDPNLIFYQSFNLGDSRIGREYADPPSVPCFSQQAGGVVNCRNSDAAAILYDDSVQSILGYVAGVRISGDMYYNTNDLAWLYDEVESLVGTNVTKIGGTTGNSYGTVYSTCLDVGPYENNIWLICQLNAEMDYDIKGGDSGSPVIAWYHPMMNYGYLTGILWGNPGRIAAFSSISGIHADFPNLVAH
jgi:hypothetical protein